MIVWNSHIKNEDAHVWHSHKDKEEDTQGICVTFTQRKVGQFHLEKEAIVNERPLCDSHTKLSGTITLGNWRLCVAIHIWK